MYGEFPKRFWHSAKKANTNGASRKLTHFILSYSTVCLGDWSSLDKFAR